MSSEPNRSNPSYCPGDIVGSKYRLVRPLGEGGMGSVWLAENTVLEVEVAIKLIRNDVGAPAADKRLLREARAAARLGHSSIVRVFDFGTTQQGDPYIVMELLRGESFAARIDRDGRLPAVEVVRLLLPVIDALATAHGKGIVHRDLKPENIFLSQDESGRIEPKLVDFGIAKLEERLPAPRLTQAGTLLGSPEYMSPEQAAGQDDVDARSDIWSLCVVLYEAICGSPPFVAANYNAVLRAILEDEPVPIVDFAAGDAGLWEILRLGLNKDRARRCASIRELGSALAQWLFDQGVSVDIRNSSVRASWIDLERQVSHVTISSLPPSSGERPSVQGNTRITPRHEADATSHGPNTLEPRVVQRPASVSVQRWFKRRAVVIAAAWLAGLALVLGFWLLLSPGRDASVAPQAAAQGPTPEPASATAAPVSAETRSELRAPVRRVGSSPESSAQPSASNVPVLRRARGSGQATRAKPAAKPNAATPAVNPDPAKPSAPASPQKAAPRNDDFGF